MQRRSRGEEKPFSVEGEVETGLRRTYTVRYSSGRGRKREDNFNRRRGNSWPKDQAECGEGSGRLHIYREVCVNDKGNVNQARCFGYTLVEMAFVVGQGVISLLGRCRGWKVSGQGIISPRQMQPAWNIRAGPKVLFCFL